MGMAINRVVISDTETNAIIFQKIELLSNLKEAYHCS